VDDVETKQRLAPRLSHHSLIGQIRKFAALQSLNVALPEVLGHNLLKRALDRFAQCPRAQDGTGPRHQVLVNRNTRLPHAPQYIKCSPERIS
jgi:hypothetical protein